jgi:hypothetical protein
MNETWEQCFWRECVNEAPASWISERAQYVADVIIKRHKGHSTAPFPEKGRCNLCEPQMGSWNQLAIALYNGDPFAMKSNKSSDPIDPEFFRPGSGKWMGKPTW